MVENADEELNAGFGEEVGDMSEKRASAKEQLERLQREVERLKRENEVLNTVAVKLHRSRAAALDGCDRMRKALEEIGRSALNLAEAERPKATGGNGGNR